MEADRRHFSVVILDEGQLSTTHLEKEIRFRFGINVESAWEGVLAPCLPEQLISFRRIVALIPVGKVVSGAKSYWPTQASRSFVSSLMPHVVSAVRRLWVVDRRFSHERKSRRANARLHRVTLPRSSREKVTGMPVVLPKKRDSDSGNNSPVMCGSPLRA
jgi:hypothetical protein